MARYIDADKVLDDMLCEMAGTGYQAMAMNVIKYAETADVVPKSEVESINPIQEAIEQKKKENKGVALGVLNELLDEKDAEIKRLKAENETLRGDLVIWKQNRFNLYQRLELYKIAQEKVAREIFEEIYEDCFDQFGYINYEALAELKKKYTESEGNDTLNNTKN